MKVDNQGLDAAAIFDMAVEKAPNQEMGREEFLKLLVAQLEHQDPMEPMKGSEFVAQLAQFSNLEQLLQVNERLGSIELGQTSLANSQTAALIGRNVTLESDSIYLDGSTVPPARFELEGNAESVTITITDESGTPVRTLDAGARNAGVQEIVWDGNGFNGDSLPPGMYKIQVSATDAGGNAVPVKTRFSGPVTGITFENGIPELMVFDMRVRLGDVIAVEE